MATHEKIPASAWENVKEPGHYMKMPCLVCGNRQTVVLSMAEMCARENVVDDNTFLIPGKTWGYVCCPACEQRQATKNKPHGLLRRCLRWLQILPSPPEAP